MVIKRIYMAGTLAAVALVTGCSKAPTVSFANDVMPVLDQHCTECHVEGPKVHRRAASGWNPTIV